MASENFAGYLAALLRRASLVRERGLFGLVDDWDSYLRESHEDGNTNFELHLRTGRPLGDAEFVETPERLVGKCLRPKKGGWPKGKMRH